MVSVHVIDDAVMWKMISKGKSRVEDGGWNSWKVG